MADYDICHHKNYKVAVELTGLKILLIILNPKLVWEKITFLPSRHTGSCTAVALKKKSPEIKENKEHTQKYLSKCLHLHGLRELGARKSCFKCLQ